MQEEILPQVLKKDITRHKRRCMTPDCKNRAWLHDWTGYTHCLKDWYRSLRWGSGEGHYWFYIKTTKIF